jgi:serine/threonine-protein kinase RsbW
VAAVAGGDRPRNEQYLPVSLAVLAKLRDQVADEARGFGLAAQRVNDLVLIANELTSNVIRHAGGAGNLRLWCDGRAVYCEVSDSGTGLADPDSAGLEQSRPEATGGRGLWIIRQLSDEVHITTGPQGTCVRVAVRLA